MIVPAIDNFRESYTVTALTSLTSQNPCWVSPPRADTNDAWDFLRTVTWLVEEGALVEGDYLILDNARVHHAQSTNVLLESLLNLHGIQMRFLPAYSPELNPCELVFAEVKHRLRTKPRVMGGFWQDTLMHFASITHDEVDAYYRHCILAPLR